MPKTVPPVVRINQNPFAFMQNPKKFLFNGLKQAPKDPALQVILLSNLALLAGAILFSATITEVLLVYWFQSITIGFFTLAKMLTYNAKGAGVFERIFMSVFFVVHYGMFHLVYLAFIFGFAIFNFASSQTIPGLYFILVGGAMFFCVHAFSFLFNFKKDNSKEFNIGELMIAPYARIIPMHLTIMAGFFVEVILSVVLFPLLFSGGTAGAALAQAIINAAVICIFVLLKTGADMAGHEAQHEPSIIL